MKRKPDLSIYENGSKLGQKTRFDQKNNFLNLKLKFNKIQKRTLTTSYKPAVENHQMTNLTHVFIA